LCILSRSSFVSPWIHQTSENSPYRASFPNQSGNTPIERQRDYGVPRIAFYWWVRIEKLVDITGFVDLKILSLSEKNSTAVWYTEQSLWRPEESDIPSSRRYGNNRKHISSNIGNLFVKSESRRQFPWEYHSFSDFPPFKLETAHS
jgi:hypothetical protein